jgi:signal transduction histidine kinase
LGVPSTKRLSLEIKLPLLMSAVLVTVLGIALLLTFTTLRSTALAAARERLTRATRQIAMVGATGLATSQGRYAAVATDSSIRRGLRSPGAPSPSVRAALARAQLPNDSGMPVELWTADGRRVAFVGNDVRTVPLVAKGRPELPRRIATSLDTTDRAPDSLRLSPLYPEGNRIHFWVVMPVRDRGKTIGYITHQRRIALNQQTQRTLRELSGDSVSIYYRNVDGSFWASGTGGPVDPFREFDNATGNARRADGAEVLVHEERIGSTPLVVGMEVPARTVLGRPRRTMRQILLLSALLVLGGVIAAWLIGRSVARPLGHITRAAGAVAAGDYNARVPATGEMEVRRLAQSFNHMAAEIGTSRAALERQTAEALAANNAKSDFLTTMSHELRTPLNAIGGYVDLLEMGLRGPVTEAQRRDLLRVKASQEHLLGLISGVLDLSRIESGRVHYDLVNVAVDPFLAGMDALIAPQAAAQSVTLKHEQAPSDLAAVADREKLRQILLNLLSNAIRHSIAGGTVTLSAEARGWQAAIIVDDTGSGIPDDKRDEIFEPFVQLDRSLTQHREGMGLGLAISRDLAHGMQGDLVVEERPGPGARFVLILPRGEVDDRSLEQSGEMEAIPDR